MDKIKVFQELIVSRFNNVLVGSFLISFLMMNSRGILTFIYSDNANKINIVKSWELNYINDLLMPFAFSIIYLTLIPLFSSLFKTYITNWIFEKEQNAERQRLLISHRNMKDVAIAAAQSTAAYAEKFTDNEIQSWLDERKSTLDNLEKLTASNNILKSEVEKLTKSESVLRDSMSYYSVLYERCINSITHLGSSIQALNSTDPIAHSMRFKYGEESFEYKKFIILKFADNIKTLFERINNKPMTIIEDWKPPISKANIDAISLYLKIEAERGTGVSQRATAESAAEVKDDEGK